MRLIKVTSLFFFGMMSTGIFAQKLDIDLQLRPRFEYRNGFKTVLKETDNPASFVSQRSRLNINFEEDKLKLKVSLQNVRVWGDVPTNTMLDKNGVTFFEAYGQYEFAENWNVKVGRQVLSYDNQRIFGEVDWTQQAQSHDAAVITYKDINNRLDIGGALNADSEDITEKQYHTKNYKSMQYAWFNTNLKPFKISLLLLNTGYEFLKTEEDFKVNYIQTLGTFWMFSKGGFEADAAAYTQTGKRDNNTVNAWNFAANLNYKINDNWKAGLGYEYLSGKSTDDTSAEVKSFTPLFGTNHAFNGYMDYFYVGNHINSVGLSDINGKINYKIYKFQFALMPHVFFSAANVVNTDAKVMNKYLGTEIDFTGSYQLHKDVTLGFGYSQMFASTTLETLKGGNADTNNWAWISLNINPRIFSYNK